MNHKTLNYLQAKTVTINHDNGWYDEGRSKQEGLLLIVTEIAEAMEAYRSNEMELTYNVDGKPEGFPSEIADVLIRLFDLCDRKYRPLGDMVYSHGIRAIEMQGVNVATQLWQLTKMVTRLESRDSFEKDVVDVYSFLWALSRIRDFDLEQVTDSKLDYNATRGYRHGNKRA